MTNEELDRLEAARQALVQYEQADENGVMVLASRQAIDEVSAGLLALRAELDAMRGVVEAAEAVRKDLIQRAGLEPEYVRVKRRNPNAVPVVACGVGVWDDFCAALDALKAREGRPIQPPERS